MLFARCTLVFRVGMVAMLLLSTRASAGRDIAASPETLPGVWRELEQGKGHTRVQDMREASGGKILSNFGAGNRIVIQFDLADPMPDAKLYVRYNNAMNAEGQIAVSTWAEGGERREAGAIVQTSSPQWNQFRWASVPMGSLPRGVHHVELICPKGKASGGLDVAVLLDDRWQGIYEPPTTFKDGKPVGVGRLISPIQATWKPAAARGEVALDEAVIVHADLHNLSTLPQSGDLTWSIEDHSSKVMASGKRPVSLKPDERQALELRLTDAMSANGWYVARFQIGGIPVGESYFASLPKITRPLPNEAMLRTMLIEGQQHWLGMNLGYGTPNDVIPDFREVGLRTIRTGGNKSDPAEHEADIQQLVDAGLRIHWILNYRGNGINPKGTSINEIAGLDLNGPVMKQWYDNYKARCVAFMKYYSMPGKERLRFYICGNEPDKKDAHTGLAGRPDIAVRLTRALAEAANEVNPTGIFVQSSSMAQPDAEYLRRMIVELGVADHCDIIGTHMYGSQTLSWRSGKPFEWLKEAGAKRLVACTESGVSTGWTPKGYPSREWQSDFMAMSFVMTRRFGYAAQILFTHDHDHTPDWALMRVKDEKLQPNWNLIQNVLSQPHRLTNGDFEAANDPRAMWTPHVNIDIPGWLSDRFDWQHTDRQHAGKSSVRFAPNTPDNPILSRREKGELLPELAPLPLMAYQVVTEGITPGKPVTVRAFARTTGTPGTTAILSVQGYDPLDGLARGEQSTTAADWTQLQVTVTPVNPWIVIGLEAPPASHSGDYVWFDDITVAADAGQP